MSSTVDVGSGALRLSGSIDETYIDTLRELIEESSEHYTRDLVIDLDGVNFLPSMGIGVLAGAMSNAEANGHSIQLLAASGSLTERILKISGLPHLVR